MDETVGSQLDEVSELRDQLQTYQALNYDLSKKVNELKIANHAANKELTTMRAELMAEKMKTSEFRRCFTMMNMHCAQFFNSYTASLKKCVETTDLEVTMPGFFDQYSPRNQHQNNEALVMNAHISNNAQESSSSLRSKLMHRYSDPTTMTSNPNAPFDAPIVFLSRKRMHDMTSTTIDSPNAESNLLLTIREETSMIDETILNPRRTSTPFLNPRQAFRDIQNVQDQDDPQTTSITKTPRKQSRGQLASPRRISEQTNCEDSSFATQFDPALKRLTVDLTLLVPSDEQLNEYMNLFHNDIDDSSQYFDVSSNVQETHKKRSNSKDEKPRRSGRPKRSSRPVIGSLVERSVRSKLRRSK